MHILPAPSRPLALPRNPRRYWASRQNFAPIFPPPLYAYLNSPPHIQIDFRQGEDVGLFCQQGSAFTGSVGVVEVNVVPDEVFSRLGRVCQGKRMQQPQNRGESSDSPKAAPILAARQTGGEEEGSGVIGQEMAEQLGKPVQTAELATEERGETEQGEVVQGAGYERFHGGSCGMKKPPEGGFLGLTVSGGD